jgi:hypothetical protein
MLRAARPIGTALLTAGLVACTSTTETSNGQEVARLVEEHWSEHGRFIPGDEFSQAERACIASRSGSVDPRALAAAGEGGVVPRLRAFVAPYADACLTDEHLVYYFQVDLLELDVPSREAVCQAPGMLRIVREHGFAAVFEDRTTEIADEVAAVNADCEVG